MYRVLYFVLVNYKIFIFSILLKNDRERDSSAIDSKILTP
ncbi:Hypothetical protein BN2458_PEG0206 [Helicobacter typhlonius]|uniref:Uncharacterized protein n=1 Tax=Helicobacter typhlonius TaxID=76936 RepID=A0A0S4PS86_9HELI|nr:Hypothetical protein BN2458_PEG0206 [Helicobacter typhlonius]